jgi:Protein of unknown function (DUF3592)
MKYILILFSVWLFFAVVGLGIGLLIFNSSSLNHFVEKGVPIYGRVTLKEPDEHQLVTFTYEVNGKQYTGIGNADRGNPAFDKIQIGEQVVVFYDSENPEESILGYPRLYARANNGMALFLAIFLPIFPLILTSIILLLYRASKRKGNDEINC